MAIKMHIRDVLECKVCLDELNVWFACTNYVSFDVFSYRAVLAIQTCATSLETRCVPYCTRQGLVQVQIVLF